MHAALLTALPAYTALVIAASRHYWARHCAECAYRHLGLHTTGRHRPDRVTRPTTPIRPAPPHTDPDATWPTLPALPRGTPDRLAAVSDQPPSHRTGHGQPLPSWARTARGRAATTSS